MTPKLPREPARKVVRALERLGYRLERQAGSHMIFVGPNGNIIPVPNHPGQDVKPGTLRRIIRDVGVSVDEFAKLMK